MTKEQQIEELTMLLFNKAGNYCNADSEIIPNMLADTLYNAGYRKVPENERFVSNMKNVLEIEKKNAVKESAKKVKEQFILLEQHYIAMFDWKAHSAVSECESKIDELLKGV